jgi:hypothetical protein
MNEILAEYRKSISDSDLTVVEMLNILAKVCELGADYCRSFASDDLAGVQGVKDDIKTFLTELFKTDNPSIPNWIEPSIEYQILAMVDPAINFAWKKLHE